MRNMLELFGLVWNPAYSDGEGDGEGGEGTGGEGTGGEGGESTGAEGAGGAGAGSEGAGGDGGAKKKLLTQGEVNAILAREKRKHQDQTQKAVDELNALKKKANITAEERQELDKRIEVLQNELLSKEELAKKEATKARKKHQGEVEKLSNERDTWKSRFTESTIKRSITDAAVANKAFHPQHIVAILRPSTHLDEVLNKEGEPTGEYEAKVDFDDVDEKGKPVKLTVTVKDAVKRMRDMEEHQNLFQGDGAGGLGSQNRGSKGKDKTLESAAKEGPEAYRAMREKMDL